MSEATLKNLAGIVQQRLTFRQGIGPVASVAKMFGLTRAFALPVHLALIVHLAYTDAELLNIAKMGLKTAIDHPETNGVPPEGFKPLHILLQQWGINHRGDVVDQAKFDRRVQYMESRNIDVAEMKQFSNAIAQKLATKYGGAMTHAVQNDAVVERSLFSLLKQYFFHYPQAKVVVHSFKMPL